jgi:uracil-DNA glycosylase
MIVIVGELNPYGRDPRYALYDEPVGSAGGRLRRIILGLRRTEYFRRDWFERGNLCTGAWSAPAARTQAGRVVQHHPDATILMLGRKVATAFAQATGAPVVEPFSRDGRFVAIPHPSGLNRAWNDEGAVERARALLVEVCPEVPWGSLDAAQVAREAS